MAELVAAYALSHSSLMINQTDHAKPETVDACFGAMRRVREHLAGVAPDVLILFGTDHFNTYSLDLVPPWCIGRGEKFDGYADNMPFYAVNGSPGFAHALLNGLIDQGFELAFSDEMKLDHSFMGPLHFVTPEMNIPVVPIFQNCLAAPFPTPRRCYDLGQAIRKIVEAMPEGARVAIMGTGGLSHWIGGPDHGRLNEEFDREFLEHFAAGDTEFLKSLTTEIIADELGNGGQEVRNWVTVQGAAPDFTTEVVYYEAIYEWLVGAAVTILEPESL